MRARKAGARPSILLCRYDGADMNKKKVLLIDDDARLKVLLACTVGNRYLLFYASDGEEGLALARAEKPDVILLDVKMPKVDGFEFLRRSKVDPLVKEIPVLMLTGSDSPDDVRYARELGASDYFNKPFSPRELLNKITEMIE